MIKSINRLLNKWAEPAAYFIAIIAIVNFTVLYVACENTFYWSDYNFYQQVSHLIAEQFQTAPFNTLLLVWLSSKLAHNVLFVVPLIPVISIWGYSRETYILSLMLIFTIPYAISIGWLASLLMPGKRKRTILLTFVISFLIPTFWIPTLRGYPDSISAMAVVLATALYLRCPAKLTGWRLLPIGILLGIAPLLRRYFAFSVIAIFITVAVDIFIQQRMRLSEQSDDLKPGEVLQSSVVASLPPVLILVGIAFSTFAICGFPFLLTLIHRNYLNVHESCRVAPQMVASYFVIAYGILTWCLSVFGFVLAWKRGIFARRPIVIFLAVYLVGLAEWLTIARELAIQYTYYSTPLIIIGMVALARWISDTRESRTGLPAAALATAGLVLVTMCNLFVGFAPEQWTDKLPFRVTDLGMLAVPKQQGSPISRLFSANFAPLARRDKQSVLSIVDALRALIKDKEPLTVISYSDTLDKESLRNAERQKYGFKNSRLEIFDTPYLNSYDYLPLEQLLRSKCVVFVHPLSFMYDPVNELPLITAHDCFFNSWDLSKDFQPVGQPFLLDGGAHAIIFRRAQPTSVRTAISALNQMEKQVNTFPGNQPEWISIDPSNDFPVFLDETADNCEPAHIISAASCGKSDDVLRYIARVSTGLVHVRQIDGELVLTCSYALRIKNASPPGLPNRVRLLAVRCGDTGEPQEIAGSADLIGASGKAYLPIKMSSKGYLLLVPISQSPNGAKIVLTDISLSRQASAKH